MNYTSLESNYNVFRKKGRVLICIYALIIGYSAIYLLTNTIVDWDDPINWTFKKRPIPHHQLQIPHHTRLNLLNCDKLFEGDKEYIEKYKTLGRLILEDEPPLAMKCEDIQRRVLFGIDDKKSAKNSIAISRVANKDYSWHERSFSLSYSPNNTYCFAIDAKSDDAFVEKINKLAECFPNVIVLQQRFPFDSSGHYINYGHYQCMQEAVKRPHWQYALWLQNYDMILRTNDEISDVIGFLNGSHLVGVKKAQPKRYNIDKDWSAKGLQLWKNETKMSKRQQNAQLIVSQNYNEVFVSRVLLEYVLKEMNIDNLLKSFEWPLRFGTDEMLWSTLLASADLQLPGQPKKGCSDNRFYFTRYNQWRGWFDRVTCRSGYWRHGTCIFGVEYLNEFSKLPQIAANKILPEFDYGIALCYGELLHNRTLGQPSTANMTAFSGENQIFC